MLGLLVRAQKVKLQDKDKATTDAWFFAVYTTISEFERMPIMASEDVGHKFSAVVSSSLRDEATETMVRSMRTVDFSPLSLAHTGRDRCVYWSRSLSCRASWYCR